MTDRRYPANLEEFWERTETRTLEPDLIAELRERAGRTTGAVQRVASHETAVAVAEAMFPGSHVPAAVLAAFLDQHFDSQLGRGDEREGVLPRAQLIPAGFAVLDGLRDQPFHVLTDETKAGILMDAEAGRLQGPDGFDSALWFKRTRDVLLLGFGSDPRGMLQMGFPGPSYQSGYTWLSYGSVDARREHKAGHRSL
jgi:hypothetical protein